MAPKIDTETLAAQYGLSAALINSDRELKALFKKAVADGWSADRFSASLKNTKWWGRQPDTLRKYLTDRYTDPATWKQDNAAALAKIRAMAVQLGLIAGHWGAHIDKAVYNQRALGWTDDRVQAYLGSLIGTGGTSPPGGDAGQKYDQIQQLLYQNGVSRSGTWILQQVRGIESARSTVEAVENGIRREAAAKYSAFAPQILAGQDALDLAAPYIQSVAKILEVPDGQIGLDNSHVAKAMATNVDGRSQTIWDFENGLRRDPLWRRTQNAQDSVMQSAHQVLTQMGLVF